MQAVVPAAAAAVMAAGMQLRQMLGLQMLTQTPTRALTAGQRTILAAAVEGW